MPVWFPKEEDLWVPGDMTLSKFLLHRIEKERNYTVFAGYDTLVSVNPNEYHAQAEESAKSTFRQLWAKVCSDEYHDIPTQAVLIAGDSGSGKTVAFGKALASLSEAGVCSSAFWTWYTHAARILAALGNASIPRNKDSTRFVNILEVSVEEDGAMNRGQFRPTLLEKSRITHRNNDESNFRILQLLPYLVASEAERADLQLLSLENATPLSKEEEVEVEELLKSLEYFGMKQGSDTLLDMIRLLSSIRDLANLTFMAGAGNEEPAMVKDGSLSSTAALLGVTVPALQLCLCQRRIMAGGHDSVHEANLTVPLAEMCRDVLAKEVYESVFWWVVARVNSYAPAEVGPHRQTLYVVDAFGFENLNDNRNKVEQLCVNYINDLVYGRYFRKEVLVKEAAIYAEQGVEWTFDNKRIPDNDLALDLVGRRNTGLLALLDEQSRLGAIGSDAGYLCETRGMWGKSNHPCYAKPRFDEDSGYVVKHFVAPVTYTVLDFVDRNSEGIHKTYANLRLLLEGSGNDIMQAALELPETKKLGDRNMGERVVTQTAALQAILDEAVKTHFILCLRSTQNPNKPMDDKLIERQALNFKIYEANEARKLPVHLTFSQLSEAFEDVYRALHVSRKSDSDSCLFVLDRAVPKDKWRMGHSLVFLSADARRLLIMKEQAIQCELATTIQAKFRMWKCQKVYGQERSALRIGAAWRGFALRKALKEQRQAERELEAALQIETAWRGHAARQLAYNIRMAEVHNHAATVIESRWRGHEARKQFKLDMSMIVKLQSAVRAWKTRAMYNKMKRECTAAAIKIQAGERGHRARKERVRRLNSIVVIQAYWRRFVAVKTFEEVCLARMHVNSLVATPFLKPGERVVLAGVVLKKNLHIGLSSWGRRVLVLTTLPRLLYIDPAKHELRGEIPYTSDIQAVLVNDQEFDCVTPKRPFKFRTLMKPSAVLWCHVLQNPKANPIFMTVYSSDPRASVRRMSIKDIRRQSVKQVADAKHVRTRTMLRDLNWKQGREIGVGKLMQMQGYMMKFEEGFFGKWTRRYFLIQENKLTWFARSVDSDPLGSISLNEAVIMRDTEISKKNSFTIEAKDGSGHTMIIRLQAFSPEMKKGWTDAIKSITKTEIYPYNY